MQGALVAIVPPTISEVANAPVLVSRLDEALAGIRVGAVRNDPVTAL